MQKYFALEYTGEIFERFFNLGDDIQTFAVSQMLPRVDGYVSREALNQVEESCVIPLNGFFMNSDHWPPAESVKPVFFAFHVTPQAQKVICSKAGIAYLKKWQPIGCRDRGTMALLALHGVETYYSRCVTLTLPRRYSEPEDGKIFVVGVNNKALHAIPEDIRRQAITVSQAKVRLPITDTQIKLQLAEKLLNQYRDREKLVITSKIHCAMPCLAMGIPVVFLYDSAKKDDYRVQLISDFIKINYVKMSGFSAPIVNRWLGRKIDWSPPSLQLEELKSEIKQAFAAALERAENYSG